MWLLYALIILQANQLEDFILCNCKIIIVA